ncbi:MAG: hypothetical protein ACOC2E_06355 [Bacteroidota bacterium]
MKFKPFFRFILATIISVTLHSCEDLIEDVNDDQDLTEETLNGSFDEDLHLTNIFDDPLVPDYIVDGTVEINAKVTIDPGVRIEFEEDEDFRITSSGHIEAIGTDDEPIVFTSANIQGGMHWKGILVRSSDIRNVLQHVVVEYAGNSNTSLGPYSSQNRSTNIGIDDDARLSVINSQINNGKGYGMFVRGNLAEHEGNSYQDNSNSAVSVHVKNAGAIDNETTFSGNSLDGVEIYGGTLEEEMEVSKLNEDRPYNISGDIDVEAPLTVNEGVRFELTEDVAISVEEAYMQVSGTQNMPVVFTRANPEAGQYWKGIRFRTSDNRNSMENVVIEYGGNSNLSIGPYSSQNRSANIALDSNSSLSLKNADIQNSNGWGIAAISNATLSMENVNFENNQQGEIEDDV